MPSMYASGLVEYSTPPWSPTTTTSADARARAMTARAASGFQEATPGAVSVAVGACSVASKLMRATRDPVAHEDRGRRRLRSVETAAQRNDADAPERAEGVGDPAGPGVAGVVVRDRDGIEPGGGQRSCSGGIGLERVRRRRDVGSPGELRLEVRDRDVGGPQLRLNVEEDAPRIVRDDVGHARARASRRHRSRS